MNKQYEAGVRCEREIQKRFPPPRYITMRTAGSKGPFDVIVIDQKDPHVYFIQAKKAKQITNALYRKWQKLQREIRLPISCSMEFWIKSPRKDFIAWGQEK